jgi:hypothetical protein
VSDLQWAIKSARSHFPALAAVLGIDMAQVQVPQGEERPVHYNVKSLIKKRPNPRKSWAKSQTEFRSLGRALPHPHFPPPSPLRSEWRQPFMYCLEIRHAQGPEVFLRGEYRTVAENPPQELQISASPEVLTGERVTASVGRQADA